MAENYLSSASLTRDNLQTGRLPTYTKEITLLTGTNYSKGTLLGRISKVCPTTGTAGGGNTGNGTCGSVAAKEKTIVGTYTLTCIVKASKTFSVVNPNGVQLADAVADVAYANSEIGFTIAAGLTAFEVGDSFTITVTAGSGKYKTALLAAVDGSQDLDDAVVLAEDMDATSSDKVSFAYWLGEFNTNFMTFGTGFTASNAFDTLSRRGIFLTVGV